jgi:adenosylhomocysteinase
MFTMPVYDTQKLYEAYSKKIPKNQYLCLNQLMSEWKESKPFQGKKILINQHITLFTLTFIHALILGGAEVEVTATPILNIHGKNKKDFDAFTPIEKANVPFYPDGNIPENKKNNYYDVIFDCGAGLVNNVIPKLGALELTKTPRSVYDNINYPVIDVDDSKTKEIETHYGTGDGFIRCILQLFKMSAKQVHNNCIVYSISPKTLLIENKYVIFGYGKVGTDIVDELKTAGAAMDNIFILDIDKKACEKAKKMGFKIIFSLMMIVKK